MNTIADAIARSAIRVSQARAGVLSGPVDANGNNLQIGETAFRAPFTKLQTAVATRMHGDSIRCQARMCLPNSLGITITEKTEVIHLPTGEHYGVVQIGEQNPISAEIPVLLRLL
jgi:hypothetical protein